MSLGGKKILTVGFNMTFNDFKRFREVNFSKKSFKVFMNGERRKW